MSTPEGRALYGWISALLGMALLAAGALLMVVMLATVIGPFSVISTPAVAAAERIALWHPASGGVVPQPVRAQSLGWWAKRFPPPVEIVEATSLAELNERSPSLLIVSRGERMTSEEVDALRDYVRQGGAVLASGWLAVGSNLSGELDTAAMRELLEVPAIERLTREQSYWLSAGGRGPLLAGIDPGQRFSVPAQDSVPALPDESAEIFWSNWAIRPQTPASGASVRLRIGKGRLVWLGVGPATTAEPSNAALDQVFRDAADWARRRPSGELLAWPQGAPFAALLAMDTEHGFPNAGSVAERARAHGFPITFLVLTQLAAENAAVLEKIAAAGEIGSHADVHDGFQAQAPALQRKRLQTSLGVLASLGLRQVRGFRPPLENYDDETLRALVDVGFGYMLGNLELTSQVPVLLAPRGPGSTLVQIPRTAIDDIELLVKRKLTDPDEFDRIVFDDVGRVARGGGLYYFSFHTQYFGEPRRLDLLERIMVEVQERKGWAATGGEIAQWWRERSALRVRVSAVGPRRIQVDVTNEGPSPVAAAAVRVYANARVASAQAKSSTIFGSAPRVMVVPGQEDVDLTLPVQDAHSTATYFVDVAFAEP